MACNYLGFIERAQTGPMVKKEDWDLDQIALTTKRLVKKYNITWNPEEVVPNNPDLANRVFQAGLELAQTVGVYHSSTGRVIQFEDTELENALRSVPQTLVMGEGPDARTLYARKVLDPRPPLVWAGNPGVPTPEALVPTDGDELDAGTDRGSGHLRFVDPGGWL